MTKRTLKDIDTKGGTPADQNWRAIAYMQKIPYSEFDAPIKGKIGKGLLFGMLAVLGSGILAYLLGKIEIFKAGVYLLLFALIYSGRYVYYAATGRVRKLRLNIIKTEEDRLITGGIAYTMQDVSDDQTYRMTRMKHHGKLPFEKGETLDVYHDERYLANIKTNEQGVKILGEPLVINVVYGDTDNI